LGDAHQTHNRRNQKEHLWGDNGTAGNRPGSSTKKKPNRPRIQQKHRILKRGDAETHYRHGVPPRGS